MIAFLPTQVLAEDTNSTTTFEISSETVEAPSKDVSVENNYKSLPAEFYNEEFVAQFSVDFLEFYQKMQSRDADFAIDTLALVAAVSLSLGCDLEPWISSENNAVERFANKITEFVGENGFATISLEEFTRIVEVSAQLAIED